MFGLSFRQRNLLIGFISTMILSALGAAEFHVRWREGAAPTELLGWVILSFIAVSGLGYWTIGKFKNDSTDLENLSLGLVGGSVIMAIVPFATVKHIVSLSGGGISNYVIFKVAFALVLVLSFSIGAGLFMVSERP